MKNRINKMRIRIIKPFTEGVDFSSNRILEVVPNQDMYFWDLQTDNPKIQLELANRMIKSGHAVEVGKQKD